VPVEQIAASAHEPELIRWWRNYLNLPPRDLPRGLRRAEMMLTAPLDAYRIAAKYDLLALESGRRAVIVDWKTERKRPTRAQLAARMQTRVYRYVLVEAGTALNGGRPIGPEQVTLVYWFAEFPAEPEVLPYDVAQYTDDASYLMGLVREITERADVEWPKTNDPTRCRLCTYRSLCERGVAAGTDDESEIEPDLDIELAQIEEIAY